MPVINVGSNKDQIIHLSFIDAYTKLEPNCTVYNLSTGREFPVATTVGNYALFAGGHTYDVHNVVDAYDTSLTMSAPTKLSAARYKLASATVGNYALFGGGTKSSYASSTSDEFNVVDAYDTSLTRSIPTGLSVAREQLAAATIGNYALFAGGSTTASGSKASDVVDVYDTSLTKSVATKLSVIMYNLASATIGNYALFAEPNRVVDAYDTSLTKSTINASYRYSRTNIATTTVGNYALFAGGYINGPSNVVSAYDTSLTESLQAPLSNAKYEMDGVTIGNYALFAGGYGNNVFLDTVDTYDTSLTKSIAENLTKAKRAYAATTVGNYALFGGGFSSKDNYNVKTVDVYNTELKNISLVDKYELNLTIPKYSTYKFTELEEQKTMLTDITKKYTKYNEPFTGYIRINGNTNLTGLLS